MNTNSDNLSQVSRHELELAQLAFGQLERDNLRELLTSFLQGALSAEEMTEVEGILESDPTAGAILDELITNGAATDVPASRDTALPAVGRGGRGLPMAPVGGGRGLDFSRVGTRMAELALVALHQGEPRKLADFYLHRPGVEEQIRIRFRLTAEGRLRCDCYGPAELAGKCLHLQLGPVAITTNKFWVAGGGDPAHAYAVFQSPPLAADFKQARVSLEGGELIAGSGGSEAQRP